MLARDYEMLRDDDRNYVTVMVALASVIAVIGGTSLFFLLQGCGVSQAQGCTEYPWQAYTVLPAPSLAISALLVQQATAATFRGRLMLALEEALVAEARQGYTLAGHDVPAYTSYHFQHEIVHGARGTVMWTTIFLLPSVLMIALIVYAGAKLDEPGRWFFYGTYAALVASMVWAGWPTLRGFSSVDEWLVQYYLRQRARGRFRV
jgi:hypothetical protein